MDNFYTGKLLHFYQPANLNLFTNDADMKIWVHADELSYEQLLAKGIPEGITVIRYQQDDIPQADLYIDLDFDNQQTPFAGIVDQPVIVNAVIPVYSQLPVNFIRINAWPGFLQRPIIEMARAGTKYYTDVVEHLHTLNWPFEETPDTPGMIAPRVIAMIINEAYFALGEDISTQQAIDTAMRSGTNYPLGPFEWAEKIGLKKIHALLRALQQQSDRYAIAPALERAINE